MKPIFRSIIKWIANENNFNPNTEASREIDWMRTLPFFLLHAACLLVIWVGFSWTAFYVALSLYFIRLFAIGGFYHRYFSHKTYETNRFWQFCFGVIAASAAQRGPIWWAAHHRQHHLVSDMKEDAHSPVQHGFFWSHIGWFLSKKHYHYNPDRVKDLARYPELVFLDRYDSLVPAVLFIALLLLGFVLQATAPELGVTPGQMLVWGFCISTIVLFHTTVSINSLSHVIGSRRFETKDNSRNNWLLALLTLGEGWHNNHHHYPATARQGFFWWEVDITYYVLKFLEKMGVIWNVKGVPKAVFKPDYRK